MTDMSDDLRADLSRYQSLVFEYEALDERIDALLDAYGGKVDQMVGEPKQRYREMFRQRVELLNEMRILEQSLHIDPDDPA